MREKPIQRIFQLKQMEEQSNEYEDQMNEYQSERNSLVEQMKKIDRDFSLSKQILQQRNEIIFQKVCFE